MNPLAELYERLTYRAVMGTEHLPEDSGLRRCMDALAPKAKKDLVFGKLYAGLTELFRAAPERRGALLLTLLEQVDAVLYTQAGYGVQGELAALPENAAPGTVQQIPYCALQALIEALTPLGSGRMEVLTSALAAHPEYFADPRVLNALIADLADPIGEMAALVFRILQALAAGQSVDAYALSGGTYQQRRYPLPQVDTKQLVSALRRGFDPEGGSDMTRRFMLICTLAGGAENDWYLSLLNQAKRQLRALIIFALGYRKENIPLLLELAQREHGKAGEMAYRALTLWDTPQVLVFWEKTLRKDAGRAVYLSMTAQDVYGDFVARHLKAALEKIIGEPHIPRKQMEDTIAPWIEALRNKASDGVIAFYQWMVQESTRLPLIQTVQYGQVQNDAIFPLVYEKICETLMLRCPQKLVDFLQHKQDLYLQEACFLADILTLPAAEVYERWGTARGEQLRRWFLHIGHNKKEYYVTRLTSQKSIFSVDGRKTLKRPLKEPLDLRWFDVLIQNDCADLFERMGIDDLPDEWREKLSVYFYQQALEENTRGNRITRDQLSPLRERLLRMHESGAENADYIVANLCKAYAQPAEEQSGEAVSSPQPYAGSEDAAQEAQKALDFYHTVSQNAAATDTILTMLKDNGFLKGNLDNQR